MNHDAAISEFLAAVRPSWADEGPNWRQLTFEQLQLDSLDLTTLCLDIEDAVGVEVRFDQLETFSNLGELSDWVAGKSLTE